MFQIQMHYGTVDELKKDLEKYKDYSRHLDMILGRLELTSQNLVKMSHANSSVDRFYSVVTSIKKRPSE